MTCKKLMLLMLALLLLVGITACSPKGDSKDQAKAYFAVFEQLYTSDTGLNDSIKYVAVDLSQAQLDPQDDFIRLMEDFCAKSGLTLLLDTIDGLSEKGYITDLYFEEGIVIVFDDKTLTANKLVTAATKWRSGLGAIGAEYTVKKANGTWKITQEGANWIS